LLLKIPFNIIIFYNRQTGRNSFYIGWLYVIDQLLLHLKGFNTVSIIMCANEYLLMNIVTLAPFC